MKKVNNPLAGIISLFKLRSINFSWNKVLLIIALFFGGGSALYNYFDHQVENVDFENKRISMLIPDKVLEGYKVQTIVFTRFDTVESSPVKIANFDQFTVRVPRESFLQANDVYIVAPPGYLDVKYLQKYYVEKIGFGDEWKVTGFTDPVKVADVRQGSNQDNPNPPEKD